MASSPRTGRSSPALVAVVIGAVLILGVIAMVVLGFDPVRVSQGVASSFFPPQAVTDRGEHIRQLYDLVFGIAVVIFFVVEGLIIWTVVRYRRKPGDDELPPQTHGNAIAEVVWTVVPTLIVAVLFVASWLTLNTVEVTSAATADEGPRDGRPVPLVVRVPAQRLRPGDEQGREAAPVDHRARGS